MSLEYVTEKMKAMAGTRFDPKVVNAFTAAVDAGDITLSGPHAGAANTEARQEVS
jgi:HD-GYP domain-containing protein (c-di-GMP phosphodiesterase class II)